MKKISILVSLVYFTFQGLSQNIDNTKVVSGRQLNLNSFGKITTPTREILNDSVSTVGKVPPAFNFPAFYGKYLNVKGIPVVSSDKVPEAALYQARAIMLQMLLRIPLAARLKIIENNVRVAIMAKDELTTAIPEHSDLNQAFPGTNWNTRARGLGATLTRPAISCAEENLLCYEEDRYRGEDIFIHEFAHTIHEMGLNYYQRDFNKAVIEAYQQAKAAGLWQKTYALTNPAEYFAEGVQCWFNVNTESIPANGVHNEINTQNELQNYDPILYNLINKYFNKNSIKISCQVGK